ncbi:hypothetical protein DDI_1663 [Dickeya dianthicola RNS04.9]|nr:hypothetical protein DDI_1663 [Dickeya dianthicola RNS04.9]
MPLLFFDIPELRSPSFTPVRFKSDGHFLFMVYFLLWFTSCYGSPLVFSTGVTRVTYWFIYVN